MLFAGLLLEDGLLFLRVHVYVLSMILSRVLWLILQTQLLKGVLWLCLLLLLLAGLRLTVFPLDCEAHLLLLHLFDRLLFFYFHHNLRFNSTLLWSDCLFGSLNGLIAVNSTCIGVVMVDRFRLKHDLGVLALNRRGLFHHISSDLFRANGVKIGIEQMGVVGYQIIQLVSGD